MERVRSGKVLFTESSSNARQIFVALSVVAALSMSASAQSTITCTSPQWDILQIMRMQTTWASNSYYLSGTDKNGNPVYMYQAPSDVTYQGQEWTGGKLNYIKNYVEPPDGTGHKTQVTAQTPPYEPPEYKPVLTAAGNPKYWGYPADVDLFDTRYIYLWITEIDWNNPYAFKKFNSNNNDYSFRFAPRCGVPGQVTLQNPTPSPAPPSAPTNNPSTAYQILPSNVYESSGQYLNDIITANETFTSADCKNGYLWKGLGYSFTQVNTVQTGFSMNDKVHNKQPSLNYLPIVYWYNCNSSYGNCQNREEFDYGYDPSTGDNYGQVRWLHFSGVNSQTPDASATFNTMQQYTGSDGKYSYTNITFPAPACFQ